ncbi:MAG: hypothetical protein NPIRA05_11500 [Nitrospirales bacterium]|nr:MAG: hypothetical protein NPIRA05_11500 [Nitrospirales bacterium]
MASGWVVEGAASQRIQYDDNIGLRANTSLSDFSSQSRLRLNFSDRTEVMSLALKSQLDFNYFLNESNLDSNNQHLSFTGQYRTLLTQWNLLLSYDRDTTLTSDVDDTGLFLLDNLRREALEVLPSWSYKISQEDRLVLRGDFKSVQFERRLVDYIRYGGEAEWGHRMDTLSEYTISGFAQNIESDNQNNQETLVSGLKTGYEIELLPHVHVRFGGAVFWASTRSDSSDGNSQPVDKEDSFGFLPSANVAYEVDARTTLHLSYARTVSPSGSGNVVKRDIVGTTIVQKWNPSITWRGDFHVLTQEGLAGSRSQIERDFIRIMPSVEWTVTDSWNVKTGYRFRWQSLKRQEKDAFSNAVQLTITYHPMKWELEP